MNASFKSICLATVCGKTGNFNPIKQNVWIGIGMFKKMKISKLEYQKRIEALQERLNANEIDTLIVSEEEDIYYLTGLTYKSIERLFFLIIRHDKVIFVLPKMEFAHLREVNNVDEIRLYWEYPAEKPERWQDVLFHAVKKSSLIGVNSKTPHQIGSFLYAAGLKVKECRYIQELRWIKNETEIELIKQASRYCSMAISKLNKNAYYGMTELEVLSIAHNIQQKVLKETEFDYLATDIMVAAWPGRISYQPHGIPKLDDVLKEGPHISVAFLRVNGYAAELERTFFTCKPGKEQQKIFEVMLEARKRGFAALKPGIVAEEVDFAAKHFLEKEGFKDNLMHRTGHGIGLGNHEGPFLAEGDKTILKENMVVSIEPGIYIEGVGGFRHSDTVRITKDGYEILTQCNDKLEDLTLMKSKPIQKIKGKMVKRMVGIH